MPYTNSPILLPTKEAQFINRSPWSRMIAAQRSIRAWFNSVSQGSCDENSVSSKKGEQQQDMFLCYKNDLAKGEYFSRLIPLGGSVNLF